MAENPYRSPASEAPGRQSGWWRRACFVGLSVTLVSGLALCGAGNYQDGGASFNSAWLALLLVGMALIGAAVVVVSGIGWAIAAARSQRRSKGGGVADETIGTSGP